MAPARGLREGALGRDRPMKKGEGEAPAAVKNISDKENPVLCRQAALREIDPALDCHRIMRGDIPKRRSRMDAPKGCVGEQKRGLRRGRGHIGISGLRDHDQPGAI